MKRKSVIAGGLALLAALCLTASPALSQDEGPGIGKDGTIAATKGKAETLQELIDMYDSSSCFECHSQQHEEWSQSVHSRSIYGTGRTAATFRTAFLNGFMDWAYSGVEKPSDVEVDHLMGCAKCHLPQLADATDNVAKELVATIFDWMEAYQNDDMKTFEAKQETLLKLNINCLVCHNRNAITHKWTDGYPQANEIYGPNGIGEHFDENFTVAKKSPIMKASILCGQCHGLGPNLELDNPTQCATGYGSYLWSYIAGGGDKTCQQCHMEESKLGHNIQSYRSEVMAEMAVEFDVHARPMVWRDGPTIRPKVMVDVAMTNKAGHGIPDG